MDPKLVFSDEAEVERLLGERAIIKLDALQPMGGPSRPTMQRAAACGMIKLIHNGSSSGISRATAKHILLHGLGPIPFVYGKQGQSRKKIA